MCLLKNRWLWWRPWSILRSEPIVIYRNNRFYLSWLLSKNTENRNNLKGCNDGYSYVALKSKSLSSPDLFRRLRVERRPANVIAVMLYLVMDDLIWRHRCWWHQRKKYFCLPGLLVSWWQVVSDWVLFKTFVSVQFRVQCPNVTNHHSHNICWRPWSTRR